MKNPGSRNSFAKKSKKMKIPSQYDNVDYGKKTKIVARSIDNIASDTGAFYGTRTIMTKESKLTFVDYLITESDRKDIELPSKLISEIKGLIRKGAADLEQAWRDAGHLVNKAFEVARVRIPKPDEKAFWRQYTEMLAFGVKQLAATRGRDGSWRKHPVVLGEAAGQPASRSIGSHRFFVTIPGESATEIDAENMDDIIEMITNKIRSSPEVKGAKVRVELRSKDSATLSVWVDDQKREEIKIVDWS